MAKVYIDDNEKIYLINEQKIKMVGGNIQFFKNGKIIELQKGHFIDATEDFRNATLLDSFHWLDLCMFKDGRKFLVDWKYGLINSMPNNVCNMQDVEDYVTSGYEEE